MKTGYLIGSLAFGIASFSVALSGESPAVAVPTLDQARRQAEILHTSMHATLQIVHHRYYRETKGCCYPLPR